MKPARKPIIIALASILILSAVNTTAFAKEIDTSGSSPLINISQNILLAKITAQYDDAITVQNTADQNITEPASPSGDAETSNAISSDAASGDQTPAQPEPPIQQYPDVNSSMYYVPVTVSSAGQQVADFALTFNGYKYVYGAASPSVGFDCSGFAYYIFKQFGYTLPRTARMQYSNGTAVEKADLQPGDLVFFATNGGSSVSHVGFYIGNNQFIHAATTRHGVMISDLDNSYWSKAYVGAKRILSPDNLLSFN